MLKPSDWFQRTVVALLLLTFVLLIHPPTNVRAAGSIEGHGHFEKITGNPSMGYQELYEWDLYLCPSDNSWTGVSRRLGAPPGQNPTYDGFYRIDNVPAGTYSILVNQPNFLASPKVETNIQIADNQTTNQHVLLDVDYSTYFRDSGEWTDWGPWDWYQTFEAMGTSIRGVSWVMAGGGIYSGKTAVVKILEDNGDPDVRNWTPIVTKNKSSLGSDTDLWLRWYSGQVPITPGKMYAVNIHIDGGLAIYKRDKDAQSYPKGRAYDGDGIAKNLDLNITVFVDKNNQIVTHTQLDSHIGDLAQSDTRWGQTFTATGTSLAAVNVYAASGLADFTLTWTVRQGGPGGPQVGPTKTIWGVYYASSTDLIGVSYNPTEVPLAPGQTYYIEFTNSTAFTPYKHKDGNAYSDGTAYKNGATQTFDLNLTIMEYDIEPQEIPYDPKGLLGYWQLDETGGDTAADSSGNDHDGTRQGDATWAKGEVKGGLCLDGASGYVDLTASDRLKPALPITLAAWVQLEEVGGHNQVLINIDKKDYDIKHRVYGTQLVVWNTGKLMASFGDGQLDYSSRYIFGDTILQPNTWYHVAVVFRGAEDIRMYLNGQDDGGTPGGSGGAIAYSDDGNSQLGCRNGDNLFLHGCIDDAVLFDVALTPEQIYRLYKLSGQSFTTACGDVFLQVPSVLDGDVNKDCRVDLRDYVWLAQEWLRSGSPLLADVYVDPGNRVNLSDLFLMRDHWLEEVDGNLIGHWKLDDGAGSSVAQDSAFYQNHGQLHGEASWTTGSLGGALGLDGDGDYVDLGDSTSLKPRLPITLAAWVQLEEVGDHHQVLINLDKKDYDIEHRVYGTQLVVWNTGKLMASFGDGQLDYSSQYKYDGDTILQPDTWYHVAAVIRGAEDIDLYINGVNDNGACGGSGGPMVYSNGHSQIGSRNGNDLFLNGTIDDVRIYTRALSAQEIDDLANP